MTDAVEISVEQSLRESWNAKNTFKDEGIDLDYEYLEAISESLSILPSGATLDQPIKNDVYEGLLLGGRIARSVDEQPSILHSPELLIESYVEGSRLQTDKLHRDVLKYILLSPKLDTLIIVLCREAGIEPGISRIAAGLVLMQSEQVIVGEIDDFILDVLTNYKKSDNDS